MADPSPLRPQSAGNQCGSGIGEAVARTLVKHGATVLAVDDGNSGVEQHVQVRQGHRRRGRELTDAGGCRR